MSARTAVYKATCGNEVVYIGASSGPKARFTAHRHKGRIPANAQFGVVKWFETRAEALAEEKRLIKELRPTFNLAHRVPVSSFAAADAEMEAARSAAFRAEIDRQSAAAKKVLDQWEDEVIELVKGHVAAGLTVEEIHEKVGKFFTRPMVDAWMAGRRFEARPVRKPTKQ